MGTLQGLVPNAAHKTCGPLKLEGPARPVTAEAVAQGQLAAPSTHIATHTARPSFHRAPARAAPSTFQGGGGVLREAVAAGPAAGAESSQRSSRSPAGLTSRVYVVHRGPSIRAPAATWGGGSSTGPRWPQRWRSRTPPSPRPRSPGPLLGSRATLSGPL